MIDEITVDASSLSLSESKELLRQYGALSIPRLVSPDLSRTVSYEISNELDAPTVAFGKVYQPRLRHDLPLCLEGAPQEAFLEALSKVGSLLSDELGMDAELVEFSSMTSRPGAPRQKVHSDTQHYENSAEMYSIFIATEDTSESMGPLNYWPGTHTEKWTGRLNMDNRCQMIGEAGDAVIMNSRLLHCGGANSSFRRRPVFYFTFLGKGNKPVGSTFSLVEDLEGKTLKDFWTFDEQAA